VLRERATRAHLNLHDTIGGPTWVGRRESKGECDDHLVRCTVQRWGVAVEDSNGKDAPRRDSFLDLKDAKITFPGKYIVRDVPRCFIELVLQHVVAQTAACIAVHRPLGRR
jgi:hypothetical protein